MEVGKLVVTRDSVCAGDDCEAPHRRTFEFGSPVGFEIALSSVLSRNYLASIDGGKATWVVSVNGNAIAVVAQQWDSPRYLIAIGQPGIDTATELHFAYHAQKDPEQVYAKLTKYRAKRIG